MNIINDVLEITDSILGLRDEFGASKHKIYILSRHWSKRIGDGVPKDNIVALFPSPWIVDYSHSVRLSENGNIKQGDILLKHISKQSYTNVEVIDCSVDDDKTEERFYYIDGKLYNVISVTEDYVYWNVQVRKVAKHKVYL